MNESLRPAFAVVDAMIAGVEERMARQVVTVMTVACPLCHGQGTTPGRFSYWGNGVESGVERCRRCDGRGVVDKEFRG